MKTKQAAKPKEIDINKEINKARRINGTQAILIRDMLDVLKKFAAKITEGGYRSVQITGELGVYMNKAEIDELRAVIAKAEGL